MSFEAGADIVRGDLDIFLTNSNGNPQNAADISYALYQVLPGPPEVEMILGSDTRTPINPAVGEYYASLKIPASAVPGTYRIRWRFKQLENTPYQTVTQEFDVTARGSTSIVSPYSQDEQAMIDRLRILCRDDRPDQRYRFRPPEQSGRVGAYNRVFGQVFRDDELYAYLMTALDDWNAKPPLTIGLRNLNIVTQQNPQWRTALYWGALSHAMFALTLHAIHDEFSYSIGGISLDIQNSSKYESLKQNAEGQFDKAAEAKARTSIFFKGLRQSRYGVGMKSSFGPQLGTGVLSPGSFVGAW